jgi:DNA polymerase-3 subunit gamma/tau
MSYLVLARKYRPQTFEQVVGQDHVTQTLRNAINADRVAHALLFSGPRGVGKTSVARIMAKAMNCEDGPTPSLCNVCQSCKEITEGISLDVFEIDGASNRGINEIRELRESMKYMPSHSRFKIYIVDEVHMLTAEAFNALLKTLEEPPSHVLFFFATTEAHKIPITMLSRCQRHNFKRIGLEDIVQSLKRICQQMSFSIGDNSLVLLAREAGGSMRDALSLLDQVMAYSGGQVSEAQVLESLGAIDRRVLFDLTSALLDGNVAETLNLLEEVYDHGHDLKRLYAQVLEHLRHLMVVKLGEGASALVDVSAEEATLMKQQVEHLSLESINQVFTTLFEAEGGVRRSAQPRLALEALFIKLAQFEHILSFDQIISKLDLMAKRIEKGHGLPEKREVFEQPKQEALGVAEKEDPPYVKTRHSEDLTQTWQQLLSVFKERHPFLTPSLERAVLTRVAGDSLEITVHGNSFYTSRLRDEKGMAAIREICREFFKEEMSIKIEEAPGATSKNKRSTESDRTRRLKREALRHPMVAEALEVFQGKVVDVKIL